MEHWFFIMEKNVSFLFKTALFCVLFLSVSFIAKAEYDFEFNGIYYAFTYYDEDLNDYYNYEGPQNGFPCDNNGNWMFGNPNNSRVAVTSGDQEYNGNVTIPSQIPINQQWGFTADVTSIKNEAFLNCTGLTSVNLEGIDTVGIDAFYGCTSLEKVEFGADLSKIESGAFRNCQAITMITCTAFTPPTISSDVFDSSVYSNATLYVPSSAKQAYKADSVWKKFYHINTFPFDFCVNGIYYRKNGNNTVEVTYKSYGPSAYSGNINIPGSITVNGVSYIVEGIGFGAFQYCTSLGTVTLSQGISRIGMSAFENTNLTHITIPSSVKKIESYAFDNCASLTDVELKHGIKSINAFAFGHCTSLKSIWIPNTIETLSGAAFNYNPAMTNIDIEVAESTPTYWVVASYCSEDGIVYTFDKKKLVAYPNGKLTTSYTIPEGIEEIGFCAMRGSANLQTVIFPSTLKTVNSYALYDNSLLAELTFPYGVTNIERYAMMGCASLATVELPSTLTYLGENTFADCSRLHRISIKAKTPPTCHVIWDDFEQEENYPFQQIHFDNTILEVPASSLESYKDANVWKNFTHIIGVEYEDEMVNVPLNQALNVPGDTINFTSTGDYPWVSMSDGDRIYARSGNAGIPNSTSELTTVVNLSQEQILDFEFKAYGEGANTCLDKCSFLIDDVEQFTYGSLQGDWSTYSVYVPAGTHILTWSYTKNDSVDPTGDYFAVDNVAIRSLAPGDVDGNGSINIDDVTALIDMLLSGNASVNTRADVDGNGHVNIDDLTTLIDYILSGN